MQVQPLPTPFHARVRLDDGRLLLVRPIHPLDAEPIRAAFPLLSEDEVRKRYLHVVKGLSEEYARHLTHPEPGRDFVVVATEMLPPGDALVGAVARLSKDLPAKDAPAEARVRAEFAILVSRFIGGQGLGAHLMEQLIAWAKREGVDEIWGDVLEDNAAMLGLCRRLGFRFQHLIEDHGVTRVSLALDAPAG
jgi:RimJ/RimL family protein N-acetyltransferase